MRERCRVFDTVSWMRHCGRPLPVATEEPELDHLEIVESEPRVDEPWLMTTCVAAPAATSAAAHSRAPKPQQVASALLVIGLTLLVAATQVDVDAEWRRVPLESQPPPLPATTSMSLWGGGTFNATVDSIPPPFTLPPPLSSPPPSFPPPSCSPPPFLPPPLRYPQLPPSAPPDPPPPPSAVVRINRRFSTGRARLGVSLSNAGVMIRLLDSSNNPETPWRRCMPPNWCADQGTHFSASLVNRELVALYQKGDVFNAGFIVAPTAARLLCAYSNEYAVCFAVPAHRVVVSPSACTVTQLTTTVCIDENMIGPPCFLVRRAQWLHGEQDLLRLSLAIW